MNLNPFRNTRQFWRRVSVIVFVLGVILAAPLLLLETHVFQQWLLRRASNFATAAGVEFSAQNLDLNLWDLRATLDGVSYNDRKGTRVAANRLMIDVPWNAFSSDVYIINDLDVDGLAISIGSDEPVVPEPSGTPIKLPRVQLDRLVIRNGSFMYRNQNSRLAIPAFSLDVADNSGIFRVPQPIAIEPKSQFEVREIPLRIKNDGLEFGPAKWAVQYDIYKGEGSTQGRLQWAPAIRLDLTFATDPLSVQNWRDIKASGAIGVENGILKITDFRAATGEGQVAGSAEISDKNKSGNLVWNAVRLDPAGISAVTEGTLNLQWSASDFSDASGSGGVAISSPQYGKAHSNILVKDGKANLKVQARAFDAVLNANVTTGLDRSVAGSFQVTYNKYGRVTVNGALRGTIQNPQVDATIIAQGVTSQGIGPINGQAKAALRNKVVSVRDIQATVQSSHINDAMLDVDLNTKKISGDIPEIDVDASNFIADLKGTFIANAQIDGSIDRPSVSVAGGSTGLDIGGSHVDSVDLKGRLADNVFVLERLVAKQASGELQSSGSVNLTTEQIQGDVHIANFSIVQVRDLSTTGFLDGQVHGTIKAPTAEFAGELRDVIYQGEGHGNITLTGAASEKTTSIQAHSDKYTATVVSSVILAPPYSFDATVTADGSRIHYQQYDFVANGKLQASGAMQPFDIDSVSFDNFTLIGEGVDLKAAGAAGNNGASGIRLDVQAALAQLPVKDIRLTGSAQAQAVLHGAIKNPEIEGTIRTADATVRTSGMTEPASIQANVDFARDQFIIRSMNAEFAGATAQIEGRGNLKGAGDFQFRAENIRPERLLSDRPLSGLIGLEGTVNLTKPNIEGLTASARVTQLELSVRDVEVHQSQPIELAVENEILQIRSFSLEGPNTRATFRGNANLRNRGLNFDVDVDTNLGVLEAFIPGSVAQGQLRTQIAVRGTPQEPSLNGFLNVSQAQLQVAEPPILLNAFDAQIQMSSDRMQIVRAQGDLNGGRFTATGSTGISTAGLNEASIQLEANGVQLEYPEGLQSEFNTQLALDGSGSNLELTGTIDIVSALYNQDIDLSQEVNARLVNASGTALATEATRQTSLLENIGLNLNVRTIGLVTVSNNLANLDMNGAFRVRGNANEPVVLGRAAVNEGGEIYFGPSVNGGISTTGERRDRYVIDTGTVEFNNPVRTEPTFDLSASHELVLQDERYLITLRVNGPPSNLNTELTSDPTQNEADIVAMLLTGRTLTELQSSYVAVAREQFVNYLSGQVSGFFNTAGTALGLDTVRLEPVTLASEEDLSARLTLGKDVTKNFNIAFSQNLKGTPSQTWIANYQTVKNLVLRGINESDKREVRFELRHDLRFGGGPPLPKRIEPQDKTIVGDVMFSGTSAAPKDLLKRVTKPGKPFNAYRMNDDARKLRDYFTKQDFLDVKVRARRNPGDGHVDVTFAIDEGPKVRFVYEGATVPARIQGDIRQIWIRGFSEGPSLRDATARLLQYFRDEGYLAAKVESHDASTSTDERRFAFVIEPGRKYPDPKWMFTGIESIDIADSTGVVMENPEAIKRRIEFELQKKGFLSAAATVPELVLDGAKPYFKIDVDQGPQFMVSNLEFKGTRYFSRNHLQNVVVHGPSEVISGDQGERPPELEETLEPFPFTTDWVETARQRITTEYLQQGFNEVQAAPSTSWDKDSGKVTVRFDVTEGERQMLEDVRLEGIGKTDLDYVMRYLVFKKGDPVDYSRINLTRKKLYDTKVFKRVDIDIVKGQTPNGYAATIRLNEAAPWRIRYGFAVANRSNTSDRELGVATDFAYGNLFGKGITVGLSLKGQQKERDGRVFGSFPVFLGRDVLTTASVFRTRDLTLPGITDDITGATLQQQWRLHGFYILSYDYSFKHIHSFDPTADPDNPFAKNLSFRIGRVNASITRDTRDDILNATRGQFLSNSFEIAPPGLGTEFKFIKNYTQYFQFRQVMKDKVWATGVRVGMARGFGGQDLIPGEQFLAGGGTTLRGFTHDELSPEPGNAALILNQEIRAALFWRIGGVAFFDAGNIYKDIRSLKAWDLRYSPGIGLRFNTPFVLLRFDLGFNPWARSGEPSRQFFFGIGQAF